MSLLEVEDLVVQFYTEDGVVRAVDELSYEIERGEKYGIVGESGAGKSVTSLSLMQLIESPGEIVSGEIRFKGQNLLDLSESELRDIRGNDIAMVFQDAETALNPVYSVGEQIAEAIRTHKDVTDEEAKEETIELLERVGIPDASARYSDYPHEFSGGMQQRAVIAMALSCDPDLLICDEPTTALDVTIEAQILELLDELASDFDTAIQLITHDLGVVAELCDRVMVLYAGQAVERAPVEELYYEPKHPYTVGLMASIPRIGDEREELTTIPGAMPDLIDVPTGCRFHPRCPYAEDVCMKREPPLMDTDEEVVADDTENTGHVASCHEYTGELANGLDYDIDVRGESQ
ncbi:ABC transporter ATP-binding protein [Natronorubrum daqingense]|uniref:ABC transporter ATP-binding protein n=1 Tax=Natronorubrum daqingense TaxID=588898 RepID=A0A1N6ZHA4_9EURY|nr:ABC transporter ATP-binding protein [Natronorubrum daqingense]APX95351.1 ABC transporter ATP-binding protein [Natronorubrum daqingense]SIR26195.1 peptide/nickel transport system ATP-binding protein [Natronorubrum daqingense]